MFPWRKKAQLFSIATPAAKAPDILSLISFPRISTTVRASSQSALEPTTASPVSASLENVGVGGAIRALAVHWPEYLMEASELAIFMISACLITALLEHPSSVVHRHIPNDLLRRFLTGLAMAGTAIGIIYSPLGKRSGAHFNPAVTLTFFRLKKIAFWDTVFYILAQFAGGIGGVLLASVALGMAISHRAINYAATVPGAGGKPVAFFAEMVISCILLLTVLIVSNSKKWSRFTPLFAGTLIATFITFEAPLSGMSMNPARTLGSALLPHLFDGLWIYFLAPLIGMLLAAELYIRVRSLRNVHCAKFHHHNSHRCIFRCRFDELASSSDSTTGN